MPTSMLCIFNSKVLTVLVCFGLLAIFVPALAASGSLGKCLTNEDCVKDLNCVGISNPFAGVPCSTNESYCVCLPRYIARLFCTSQNSCARFETCTEIPDSLVEQVQPEAVSLHLRLCIDDSQAVFVQNLTLCDGNQQCLSVGGQCIKFQDAYVCASPSIPEKTLFVSEEENNLLPEPTAARLPQFTGSPADTESGFVDLASPRPPATLDSSASSEPVSTPEENLSTNVCIASKHLRHMPPELLLYKNHYLSHVLCDCNGSCATPGHIVVYKGQSMMMSSYCSQVKCQQGVMHVNSLRYRSKLRISSKTKDLEFSAFAARRGTRVEETFLNAIVRLGL